MVRWMTFYYKEIRVPIRKSPSNILILLKDMNASSYQALLLVILSCSFLERSPVCLYLLSSWASFLDKQRLLRVIYFFY